MSLSLTYYIWLCPMLTQAQLFFKLESMRPTAADSRTVGRLHCFFVLFSILLDADASVI